MCAAGKGGRFGFGWCSNSSGGCVDGGFHARGGSYRHKNRAGIDEKQINIFASHGPSERW